MPFPKFPIHLIRGGQTSPTHKQVTDEETGIITDVVKPCNEKLPPAEYFKIENQIKAGITLNEVNTQVLTNDIPAKTAEIVTNVAEKARTRKSTKQSNNEENA